MWERKDLKDRAKKAFRGNYWRTLLVTIAFMMATAGGGIASGWVNGISVATVVGTIASGANYWEDLLFSAVPRTDSNGYVQSDLVYPASYQTNPDRSSLLDDEDLSRLFRNNYSKGYSNSYRDSYQYNRDYWNSRRVQDTVWARIYVMFFAFLALGFALVLILGTIRLLVSVFVYGPLELGASRFYLDNLHGPGRVSSLGHGFDHHYMNGVKIMFLRGLFTSLWSLLFLIPGIVKSYEYQMIPYLLAEYPDMPREDAFAVSRYMMNGNKFRSFVLDLSFIPWFLLGTVTLGISNFFWANPYVVQTRAALYEAIKEEKRPFDRVDSPIDPTPQVPQEPVSPVAPTSPFASEANLVTEENNPFNHIRREGAVSGQGQAAVQKEGSTAETQVAVQKADTAEGQGGTPREESAAEGQAPVQTEEAGQGAVQTEEAGLGQTAQSEESKGKATEGGLDPDAETFAQAVEASRSADREDQSR